MLRRMFLTISTLVPFFGKAAAMNEQEARKARSVARLKAEKVPLIDHLPVIETVAESTRRTKDEVVRRAIALVIVAVKGETGDSALAYNLVRQFNALGFFTPQEQAFIDNHAPDEQQRTNFAWRYECVNVMLWALQIHSEIKRPEEICDVSALAATLRELGADGLFAKGSLRPQPDLLDAADLIYRYHWAVVNARLKGEPAPAGLDSGVVYERHYALNWVTGYMDQDWDDISTDT